MNRLPLCHSAFRRPGCMAVLLLSGASLLADPVVVSEGPPRPGALIPICFAILLEAIYVRLLLRHWRRPGLFILWLMGMHLLTYPLLLAVLWLSYGLHPMMGVVMGEGLIVLLEGCLIYLMCRFLSSAKSELPVPSIGRSLFASLIGNICSSAIFPLLLML